MRLLGIDTATLTLTMAVAERDASAAPDSDRAPWRLLARADEPPPAVHSRILPARLLELLDEAGTTLEALDGIVIGVGPGSFTGLRISLASVKGLCYARGIPLVGVSSLAAMALAAAERDLVVSPDPEGTLYVPCLDARKGEVYTGFFRRRGGTVALEGAELVLKPEALAERVAREENVRGVRVFGIGREAYPALTGLSCAGSEVRVPDAWALIRLAPAIPPYDKRAVFAVEPHYVRPPEAEWKLSPRG